MYIFQVKWKYNLYLWFFAKLRYDVYYVLDWVAKSLYRLMHTKEFPFLSNSVLLINPFSFPAEADGHLPMLGVYFKIEL